MKNKKIIYGILFAIIIIGIIVASILKFNYSIDYEDAKKLNIYISKQVNIEDIESIVSDIFGTRNKVEYVETFKDMVLVTIPNIYTEEQETELKNELVNRINNKYETDINSEDVKFEVLPHFRGRDFIKRYVKPIIITAIIILVYFGIRYNKLGSLKVAFSTILNMALVESAYISLIAITRIEINKFTVPFGMLIAVITLVIITNNYEQKLENEIEKEKNAPKQN